MKNFNIPIVDDFLFEKSVNQGLSIYTIKDYQVAFTCLLSSEFVNLFDLSTFTETNFKKFLSYSLQSRGWKSCTFNRVKKNLKVFCDFLVSQNILQENPLKNIKNRKMEKPFPKYLDTQKVNALKRYLNSVKNTNFYTMRDTTILYVYLFTGIRLSELINLTLENINFLDGYLTVKKGKGNKDRIVPINTQLSSFILDYYYARIKYKIDSPFLFPTRFGKKLQHREIYKFLSSVSSSLGFKVTPHMFRHTFATELVRKNINLFDISRVLGHTNLNTTKIYLGLDIQNIKDKINLVGLYS